MNNGIAQLKTAFLNELFAIDRAIQASIRELPPLVRPVAELHKLNGLISRRDIHSRIFICFTETLHFQIPFSASDIFFITFFGLSGSHSGTSIGYLLLKQA